MKRQAGTAGKGKLLWVLAVAVLALAALAACVALGAAGWFFAQQPGTAPAPVSISSPAPVIAPPAPPSGNVPVVPNGVAEDDFTAAGEAMYNWPEGDQRNFPYQVDGVQVRGNRAIGNYTPVTRDGRPDPERPGGLFVAHKVNGVWKVYALGTDIIDPWAEPITRIYGDP